MYYNLSFFITLHNTFIRTCRFKQFNLGNHSQLDTRSYNFFLKMADTITCKILICPPESSCILVTSNQRSILYYHEKNFSVFNKFYRLKNMQKKTYFTIPSIHITSEFLEMRFSNEHYRYYERTNGHVGLNN